VVHLGLRVLMRLALELTEDRAKLIPLRGPRGPFFFGRANHGAITLTILAVRTLSETLHLFSGH
jgi:hypothetical protein